MSARLAQINIARLKAPLTDPSLSGFVGRLDEINALAEQSDGFIWRLVAEAGTVPGFDDPDIIVNMSVWRDVESLKRYVYESTHLELLKSRHNWFVPFGRDDELAHQAMWWIDEDTLPTVADARARLTWIKSRGAGPLVFNFAKPWPVPVSMNAMQDSRLSGATESDGPQIRELLASNDLPIEDLSETHWHNGAWTWFIVARVDDKVVGAGALEPVGSHYLLRSVVVASSAQRQGLGESIVNELVRVGQRADGVYLLTETAADYFAERGFHRVERNSVPAAIAGTAQFSALCPDSAITMTLTGG